MDMIKNGHSSWMARVDIRALPCPLPEMPGGERPNIPLHVWRSRHSFQNPPCCQFRKTVVLGTAPNMIPAFRAESFQLVKEPSLCRSGFSLSPSLSPSLLPSLSFTVSFFLFASVRGAVC